jgi:hypothetical protein
VILRVKTEVYAEALLDAIHDEDHARVSNLLRHLEKIDSKKRTIYGLYELNNYGSIYQLFSEMRGAPKLDRWGDYARDHQQEYLASLLRKEQAVIEFKQILKKRWGEDLPLLLADFGIVTKEEYSQKLKCTPDHLSRIGICSQDDLQALFNFNSPDFQYLQVEEVVDTTANPQTIALNKKKILVTLLDRLFTAAQQKSDEIKRFSVRRDDNGNVYEDKEVPNPWGDFQNKLKSVKETLLKATVSPKMLLNEFIPFYPKHVEELNALIDEFRTLEKEPKIQVLKLYDYINQVGIFTKWTILKDTDTGIDGLSTLLQQKDAPQDIFAMGV